MLKKHLRYRKGQKMSDKLDAFLKKATKNSEMHFMNEMHVNTVVPTHIPSYNRASVIGGVSTGGMYSLCGPTAGGKTALGILFCNAFAERGLPSLYIDAETTADKPWFEDLGMDLGRTIRLVPDHIEHASVEVDDFIAKYKVFRDDLIEDGQTPGCIIILDSLNKIRPKDDMETTEVKGRQYPLHANLITQWFNKLTPTLYKNDIAFMFVRHDRANMNKQFAWQPDEIASGPSTAGYDSTFVVRVSSGTKYKETVDGAETTIGYWHNFIIEKNKDGIKDERGKFFLSNGRGNIAKGYDKYLTVIEEAIYQKYLEQPTKGNYLIPGKIDKATTKKKLRKLLEDDNELYNHLVEELTKYWIRGKNE